MIRLFFKVFDKDKSQRDISNGLSIISEWTFQWKMQLNPDLAIKLNDRPAQLCESQKHLGAILDKHLNFYEHSKRKTNVYNKLIGTIKHLTVHLPKIF